MKETMKVRFFRYTSGTGASGIQGQGLSGPAHWGMRGLHLEPEDGPAPERPKGSYTKGPGGHMLNFNNVSQEEVPPATVLAACRRLLKENSSPERLALIALLEKIVEAKP